ncbi:MAG: hypothetical protein Q9220_006091 [cf. Caloplaca sp. 1 TL-2023]
MAVREAPIQNMVHVNEVPPVLSTPATHILEDDAITSEDLRSSCSSPERLDILYEIDRTVAEIKQGRWERIALQFPDQMLRDAPSVFERLTKRLAEPQSQLEEEEQSDEDSRRPKVFILADTSYGGCCVDEIAAEHVDADVVVHYGRACLSPTVRLPVIHIFTTQPISVDAVIQAFEATYSHREESIILTSDVTFEGHLAQICSKLSARGYSSLFAADVVHSPSSPLPNRTVPDGIHLNPNNLQQWRLFHISEPPDALLLTLASRVLSIHILPGTQLECSSSTAVPAASATVALRRRYAQLTSVSTVPVFGILINTLSVKNFTHVVDHVKSCISAAGKKSYTFVVGKLNAAKVANFSDIGAWVVIGCWESSLIDSKDFWRPILTPFELELALTGDEERVWTGEWKGDFESILAGKKSSQGDLLDGSPITDEADALSSQLDGEMGSEPESSPPSFDLRTGRYVSHTRPMQRRSAKQESLERHQEMPQSKNWVAKVSKGDVATVGNEVSPGAEFLRSERTWKGLGSDFEIQYDLDESSSGAVLEEGRSGLAKGYLSSHSKAMT